MPWSSEVFANRAGGDGLWISCHARSSVWLLPYVYHSNSFVGLNYCRICLAVSSSWKRLLESSHKLWTVLDTSYARKPVSQRSLRAHFKRSNYSLDRAIVTMKAAFDASKWNYLFRTCKKLRRLEILGTGFIGDSLNASLQLAQSLEVITVSKNCEITVSAVQLALKTCQKTLVDATFLKMKGTKQFGGMLGPWPKLESLKTLHFRATGDSLLNIVSL